MCGRFALSIQESILRTKVMEIDPDIDQTGFAFRPSPNIAPSAHVPVVLKRDSRFALATLEWGFKPHWAKTDFRAINARSEDVFFKPFFREAILHSRCVFMAEGFYEWRLETVQGRQVKQPYLFRLKDHDLMLLAGVWDVSTKTAAILTTAASGVMSDYHDRMPVMLNPSRLKTYLVDQQKAELETQLALPLVAREVGRLVPIRVSTVVNNPSNQTFACMEPMPDHE